MKVTATLARMAHSVFITPVFISRSILVLAVLFSYTGFQLSWSQIPQGFNYQAVARDSDGSPLSSVTLQVRIGILSDTTLNTIIWEEIHNPVVTSPQGIISLVVGKGTRQAVSTVAQFSDIQWTSGQKFIRTAIYYQGSWREMGNAALWSVPYAMAAGDLTGSVRKLEVAGETTSMDEALFEVRNRSGQTVFAVYNEGVRVNVGDGASKASKGGFAIGSFNETKQLQDLLVVSRDSVRFYLDDGITKATKGGFAIGSFNETKAGVKDYLHVSKDSVRVYLDETGTKATKGGFAIGSFNETKAGVQDYLRVSSDSIRMYVTDTPSKAVKGGFAIGSFNETKGVVSQFTSLTPDNYLIGHSAGSRITSGQYNSFMGFEAGMNNTTGSLNAFFGYKSGFNNISGGSNLFLGYWSGYTNTTGSFNTFVGYRAGALNTTGGENTFVGSYTGSSNTTGLLNSFVGYYTGFSNTTGKANSFFGNYAGYANTEGASNVFLGNKSGYNNTGGSNNVYIGDSAGYKNTYGASNVYIGNLAGYNGNNDWSNIFIGYKSGYSTTNSNKNVFIGTSAGRLTTWGSRNVFIGDGAGEKNTTGGDNVAIGVAAGQSSTASNNVFIGYGTGYINSTGASNVFLGVQAGWNNTTGGNNIFIGSQSGYFNSAGTGNIFIGRQAGWNETGSNKLYIDNSSTATPLLLGDFGTRDLTINGRLNVNNTYFRINGNPGTNADPDFYVYQGSANSTAKNFAFAVRDALWVTGPAWFGGAVNIEPTGPAISIGGNEAVWYNGTYFSWGYGGTYNYFARRLTLGNTLGSASYMLYVAGSGYATGSFFSASDGAFKRDVEHIDKPLEKVLGMQGVRYRWKTDEYADKNFPGGHHFGVIAQDIEKVIPEVVQQNEEGDKAVAYTEIIPVMIEAIKEQQKIIDEQQTELGRLKAELELIKSMIVIGKSEIK